MDLFNRKALAKLERDLDRAHSNAAMHRQNCERLEEFIKREIVKHKVNALPKPLPEPPLTAADHRAEAERLVHRSFAAFLPYNDNADRDRWLANAARHLRAAQLLDEAKPKCLYPNDPGPCDCS